MFLKKLIIFGVLLIFLLGPCSSAVTGAPITANKNSVNLEKAIFIAKLNERSYGFCEGCVQVDSIALTSNKKYWIVRLHDTNKVNWKVSVNVRDGSSKKNNNRWKSFNELKAYYVAELNSGEHGFRLGKPYMITLDGKKVWKISVYNISGKLYQNVYFNVVNGKSKINNNKWKTLKEIDAEISKKTYPVKFRDALRDFYPD